MLEYLYTHKGKYYSGQGLSYISELQKIKLKPKNFPKHELLCFFVQAPTDTEIKQMAKDFSVEEKYFIKFKTESRSIRYSFDPLIFCMTDYIAEQTSKIHVAHLLLVIKHNVLLVVVSEQSKYFKELFDKVIDKTQKRKLKSEAYILYEFLHQDAKENYEVIESVDDKLAALEKRIISGSGEEKIMLQEIMSQKKYLIKMNKRLWASSKIIFTVKKDLTSLKLTQEEQALLDDIYDTFMHQIDLIETQKETVTDLLEIYTTTLNNKLAEISNKLNIVMKKMAALTIIIMVPTLIAGIYGTNFHFLPEIAWKYGYLWLWGFMIAAGLFTWYSFHKKGWI
ncbi:MAG: magnesium transporter CorA family protein [Candidatus Woesearchaeota archaeon]